MTQVDKIPFYRPLIYGVTADARLNSFHSPSYVHIEAQYSPSTSPVAKPGEHTSTYTSHVHVHGRQQCQFPAPVSSSRPTSYVRSPANDPKRENQAAIKLRHSSQPRRSRLEPSLTAARSWPTQPRWHPRGGPHGLWGRPVQSIIQATIESYSDTQS
jgi:hypothetical protein